MRNPAIDAFRLLAFVAVVVIHSLAMYNPVNPGLSTSSIIVNLMRFAVPFFFIVSGYFLVSKEAHATSASWNIIRRTLPAFFFWAAIYLLLSGHPFETLTQPLSLIQWLFSGAPGIQLWFLPALVCSAICALWLKKLGGWLLLWIGASLLYCLCVAYGAYENITGLHVAWWWNARYGPLAGTLFVAIGMRLKTTGFQIRLPTALVFACLAAAVCLLEGILLYSAGGSVAFEFGLTTPLFGTVVFLLALALPHYPLVVKAAPWGRLAFGMYAVHYLFILVFRRINHGPYGLYDILAAVIITIAGSILVSYVLSRIHYLRRFVV